MPPACWTLPIPKIAAPAIIVLGPVVRPQPFRHQVQRLLDLPLGEGIDASSGLIEDEDGEICIYRSFWSPSFAGNEDSGLSPLIIYADIVDSINPGNWDVAKTFYGEAVADLLQD